MSPFELALVVVAGLAVVGAVAYVIRRRQQAAEAAARSARRARYRAAALEEDPIVASLGVRGGPSAEGASRRASRD